MTNNEERQLQKGDRIRCKDANDAVEVAIELGKMDICGILHIDMAF